MDNHNSPPRPPSKNDDNTGSKGHTRTFTPFESPARTSRPPIPSTPGGYTHFPSTPGHTYSYHAPGTPSASFTGPKMAAELNTPVISNANIKYVDDEASRRKGTPPSQLGLPRTAPVDKSTSYGVPSGAKNLAPRTLYARRQPDPFKAEIGSGGLGVMKSLAMPSGLYSDDSSVEDGAHNNTQEQSFLCPIELKPNRFHSFQGSSQYEKSNQSSMPTILSPAMEVGSANTSPVAVGSNQYIPNRNAHGVKELSEAKDLDAIFKDDRHVSAPRSPNTNTTLKIVSPMSVDDDDEEEHAEVPALGNAIPMDNRDWSIPSIRLANHVTTFGMDGSVHSYHSLFSDEDDYTDGSSFDGSYLGGEDDDLSLSSKEDYDKVKRWRRMSGVLRRANSQNQAPIDTDVVMMPPPQVTRTVPTTETQNEESPMQTGTVGASLLEQRFSDIALSTDSSSNVVPKPVSNAIYGPPPILNITAQSFDEAGVNYTAPTTRRRRRNKKNKRSHSYNSEAALEWIQNLQQSNTAEGGQIIEAASSKFLTGNKSGGGEAEMKEDTSSQDVTKALGMAHPLCRSSTIEAGGFSLVV